MLEGSLSLKDPTPSLYITDVCVKSKEYTSLRMHLQVFLLMYRVICISFAGGFSEIVLTGVFPCKRLYSLKLLALTMREKKNKQFIDFSEGHERAEASELFFIKK